MITASVVLFHTPQSQIDEIIRSFSPSDERKLFFIDNSPELPADACFNEVRKNVFLYRMGKNAGYGTAHNVAIREAIRTGSDFHVVLNPDLSFDPSVIDALSAYAGSHPDVVYMLPEVLNRDGVVQHLCKLLPTPSDLIFRRFFSFLPGAKSKNDRYVLLDSGYDHIINPPCLSGCFMFLRVSALKKNGLLFDERFFMYCEDFDFMRRLHRYGRTIYYPYVSIVHDHSQESYHSFRMLRHHIASAIRYFNKYGWFYDPERKKENARILSEIRAS